MNVGCSQKTSLHAAMRGFASNSIAGLFYSPKVGRGEPANNFHPWFAMSLVRDRDGIHKFRAGGSCIQ